MHVHDVTWLYKIMFLSIFLMSNEQNYPRFEFYTFDGMEYGTFADSLCKIENAQ